MGQNCSESMYVSKLSLKFPPLLIKVVVARHLTFPLLGGNSIQIANSVLKIIKSMMDRFLGTSLDEIKYRLLTKREFKMAAYWPSCFLRVYGSR